MRIELILIAITIFIVGNIYTEGKWTKVMLSWKKYYQMGGVVVAAFFIYWMFKKNPMANWGQMLSTTNDYLKYLPVDSKTSSILSPILDFTSKQNIFTSNGPFSGAGAAATGGGGLGAATGAGLGAAAAYSMYEENPQNVKRIERIMQSGNANNPTNGRVKRSVSETKKKFVASRQNWKCGECKKQLNAWFEVDHKIRLEHGGSNHVDNLVALCRECHGEKTTIENL
jgi:hypothetical protein